MNKENQTALDREVEFLENIYKAAQMGRDALERVNNNIGPGELRNAVENDIFDYSDICAQTEAKLVERNVKAEAIGKIPLLMANMMIELKVDSDEPDGKIAKMIIDGTTKGITECTVTLSDYGDVDPDVVNIGYKFLWIQQRNIDEMKRFLHSR